MRRAILASVSVLVLCGIASGYDYNISWIHGENPPDFVRVPYAPTTTDLIHFSVPTDIFINQWVANQTLGGTPTLSIDPVERTIELWFQGPPPGGVVIDPDPVCGLEGYYGPLEEGTWLFYCHFPGTIWLDGFDVIPPTPIISGRVLGAGGMGINGVSLTFSNGGGSTTTDGSGYYTKMVPDNWSGMATPSKSGYIFSPPNRSYVNVTSDISDQDYVGFRAPLPAPDYFTEQFSSDEDAFDLLNKSIMFTPTTDGTLYSAYLQEITELPTDPVGGTELALGDDSYEFVKLSNQATVFIFGSSFSSFYVGSNGYITFTEGDNDYSESLSDHFDTMRISGLFGDLNPSGGGMVSWKQLADRVVVTWENVPEYVSGNSNTFQIEMYFDGRIQLSWLAIEAESGIVGLSDGLGMPPDFQETDISEKYPLLTPMLGYFTEQFSSGTDTFDLSNRSIMFKPTIDSTSYSYSAYQQKITELPTDPAGGIDLALGDDSYEFVNLSDQATVFIFGSSFSSFYVGSNGYITFTEGDNDYSETLSDHFDTMRISGLFGDLNPSGGGMVSWKQLADRVVVTWENVPEYGSSNSNTFQIEMYFDGRIQLSWLAIEAENGIVGLSDGLGVPEEFQETDFSEM